MVARWPQCLALLLGGAVVPVTLRYLLGGVGEDAELLITHSQLGLVYLVVLRQKDDQTGMEPRPLLDISILYQLSYQVLADPSCSQIMLYCNSKSL